MQKANAPTQFVLPFAGDATSQYRNVIPIPSQQGTTPGLASFTDGFPPVTMEPAGTGGIPPYGADMNGILYDATLAQQWQQAGYLYPYNSTFANNANVNGYPAGALLNASGGSGFWFNKVDNNITNPDTSATAGWVPLFPNAGKVSVATTGGSTTLLQNQITGPLISISGALTSNATLVLPLLEGSQYAIQNSTTGSFTLTVQSSSGAGVAIAQGSPQIVFCDGTNWYAAGISGGPFLPLTGTAVAATKLAAARNFSITGMATAAAASFDGTGNVTLNVTALNVPSALGYTPANDANVVHIAGTETITGTKTFASALTAATVSALTVTATSNSFVGGAVYAVLSTSAPGGNVFFRPNGPGSATGQTTIDTNGIMTVSGEVIGATVSSSSRVYARGWGTTEAGQYASIGVFEGAAYLQAYDGTNSVLYPLNIQGASLGFTGNATFSGSIVCTTMNATSATFSGAVTCATMNATSATFSGAVTCATMNATSSDRRLKRDIKKREPRPLHRSVPFVSYVLKENGWQGLGSVAQTMQKTAPEHVGEFEWQPGKKRLSLNYAGAAYEQAFWAGAELDRQAKLIAQLTKRLAKLEHRA